MLVQRDDAKLSNSAGLSLLLGLDLLTFATWAIVNIVFLLLRSATLNEYRSIHATYVVHAMATLRLIYVCTSSTLRSRGHRWAHTMAVFVFAAVFDAFNVADTHVDLTQTVFWAWTVDLVIAYSFLTTSLLMVVYGATELNTDAQLSANPYQAAASNSKR
jgi:hypothetical protein